MSQRNDSAMISAWVTVIAAALSVLVVSGFLIYYVADQKHDDRCDQAYNVAQRRAQSPRIEAQDLRDEALIVLAESLLPENRTDPETSIRTFVTAAKKQLKVKSKYPYPTSSCPTVKGINA